MDFPGLLDLNDDVLLHIMSYIHGKDALNFAVCSGRAHALADPRIGAVVVCRGRSRVRRLRHYMLSTLHGVPRARFLESLTFIEAPKDHLAQLIGDFLCEAHNIREFLMEARFHYFVANDPRIGVIRVLANTGFTP